MKLTPLGKVLLFLVGLGLFLTAIHRALPPELRARLSSYFEPYNRELYRWMGKEFDWS